ncbi:dynamin family protein [Neobacillus rhizosphaerae]|uniref:dynamin family protein n=1 Tax=Neobacillus rhizosphaerae TaxID=2880965 RepID=UPI003D289868
MLNQLNSVHSLFSRSPLLAKQNQQIPYGDTVLSEVEKLRNETEVLLEKVLNPLKIVLMGEVKAGKSTLLNSFSGAQVSPTNVTETTASIIEIKHSLERKGLIELHDGDAITGTTDDVFAVLKQEEGNQEFFTNVSVVKLSYPLANLQKLHLVDTPGLATITEENQQRAVDYIQNSDVILWVFNAHHIGQLDVEAELEKVKFYGKPIIGVVNRIDEIDGSPERVKAYVEDRLGFFLDEVFTLSAYQAFKGSLEGDQNLVVESGFAELMDFLESKIEANHDEVQEASLIGSAKALIEKSRWQHQLVVNSFEHTLTSMKQRKEELSYYNENIKRKIKNELEEWLVVQFLVDEKEELLKMVDRLGVFSGKGDQEAIRFRMEEILSNKAIEQKLAEEYDTLNRLFRNEWESAIEKIGEKIAIEAEEFAEKQEMALIKADLSSFIRIPQGENAIADGAMKGVAIGGAYGVAASAYAAVIGPYAATVTIGSALGAFLPPVLIIGAVTGAVTKLVLYKKKKNEYFHQIDKSINELKNIVKSSFAQNLMGQIEKDCNETAKGLYEKYSELLSNGWTEPEITAFHKEINQYQSELFLLDKQFELVGV